ncbi:hypothetical protein Tco_0393909 [Tanacetum coccineum]
MHQPPEESVKEFEEQQKTIVISALEGEFQPPQETSVEILQAKDDLMKSIQTFLKKFNRISFGETPKILLLAWEKFFEIQHAKPEDIQDLLPKLLEDLKIISEELAEFINSPSWNRPTFYDDDDDEYTIIYRSTKAITHTLATEEPGDSLIMGDEHLSTIPEKESTVSMPTFVFCFPTFTKGLGATVLNDLAALTGAVVLEKLCLAVLNGTRPDLVKTAVGAKFFLA